MKKLYVVLLILALAFVTFLPIAIKPARAETSADSWATMAPMPTARSVLGVTAVNGRIYAIGGSNTSGMISGLPAFAMYGQATSGFVGTNEEYDPSTNTWANKAPMPTPRMAFAIAAYQNKIYCIGGRTTTGYTNINEVYNPASDTWVTKAPMPNANGWLTANIVGDKIYVIDDSGNNYVYEPATDSWTTKTSVPSGAFDGYASTALDSKIYVVGGLSKGQDSNLNFIFDTQTDNWTYGTPPPSSQGGGAASASTGTWAPARVYVFGEIANLKQGENPTFVRIYNPKDNTWSYGSDSPTVRYDFGVAVVDDVFYIIGGHTFSFPGSYAPTAANEKYVPSGYGTVAPIVTILSPENNQTFLSGNITLVFTLNKPATQVNYILNGEEKGISGNITLTSLPAGNYNLTLTANDTYGNQGYSQTITFTVTEQATQSPSPSASVPEFPTSIVLIATFVAAAIAATAFTKRSKLRWQSFS